MRFLLLLEIETSRIREIAIWSKQIVHQFFSALRSATDFQQIERHTESVKRQIQEALTRHVTIGSENQGAVGVTTEVPLVRKLRGLVESRIFPWIAVESFRYVVARKEILNILFARIRRRAHLLEISTNE